MLDNTNIATWYLHEGDRFRFDSTRVQEHVIVAILDDFFVYRDPVGRLQETDHQHVWIEEAE